MKLVNVMGKEELVNTQYYGHNEKKTVVRSREVPSPSISKIVIHWFDVGLNCCAGKKG